MRKWITGCLVFASLVAGGVSLQAQQLLNGSFEDPEAEKDNPYGDLAAHWGRWGNWMNRETGWVPTHNGQCIIGYHHWEIVESNESGLYQDVPGVTIGSTCTFDIYASKDDNTNVKSIEMRLEPFNGGKTLASKTYAGDQIKSGTYGQLSITGTNTTEGIRVLVVIKPAQDTERKGAVKLDDAALDVK